MDSRKRSFAYNTLQNGNDGEVLSKRHKTDCVKNRHNKIKEHLKEYFADVKNTDRMDDCFNRIARCLMNPHFPNESSAEVDTIEPESNKVSMDYLHSDTSQACSYKHTQRNMIENTPCGAKSRFENVQTRRSNYLFADTTIKSDLNSFGSRFKEARERPLSSTFNATFPPFSTSQTCKTFVPELAKGYVEPVAKPMSNVHNTMPSSANLKEKEQYKLLLEKFSKNKLFFSTAIPALKNWQEWSELVSGKEPDSIGSKVTLDNDEKPLTLNVEPRKTAELPPGMFKGKLTVEFVQGLKKLLDEDYRKARKSLEERHCQISMHYEKQAANRAAKRAAFLKKLQKDRFVGGRDALKRFVLPELTPEMDAVFEDVFMSPHTPYDVMCKIPDDSGEFTLLHKDFETLSGSNWLNDEIINGYLKLIVKRSQSPNLPSVYAFQTFFYTKVKSFGHSAVKRWTKKIDIFSFDILLVPIHLDLHWCLGVVDNRHKKVQYYDSMGGPGEGLPVLQDYLCAESLDKKKIELNVDEWTLETVKDIPQQLNGNDCGMFALKYAEYITRNAEITFTQQDMPYFRRKMVYELKTAKI